ncbi:MAG TPA: RNA polymerase sigma factor SigJ [Aggregatilineales bacterium]|nr:RNA polymerase sigma factor SigJ [Aggregatilineales bacterium]
MNTEQSFESYRPLLFSIAYRMLGSAMEAEDMVQEAFRRDRTVAPEGVESPRALLCTIVARLCLNYLESARVQREAYIGPWPPEPLLTGDDLLRTGEDDASALESISLAFLVLLENLTPSERAVFLLHEVFDFGYDEVARIVDKDEAACRQLFSRAKKHIAEHRPCFHSTPEEHGRLLERFLQAVTQGEPEGLMQLLADDVTMWADGGGKARGAATQPLHGPAAVARFVLASTWFAGPDFRVEFADVNGRKGVVARTNGRAIFVLSIEVDQGRIRTVRVIGNPDKLGQV